MTRPLTRDELVKSIMEGNHDSLWMRISESLGFPASGFTEDDVREALKQMPPEELALYI